MPLYQVDTMKGRLTASAKTELVNKITDIHCSFTGAPEAFVNVVFREYTEGDCFVARKPEGRSFLGGQIRHGRSVETRQAMLSAFRDMWVQITGQSEAELVVALAEVDPRMALEAGLFMPEPGHEEEWFEEHHARLAELGVQAG
ncbi:tautomerase family protein [Mycolicibacterium sp.]|uniref:tautomerase family protein n=1 Tax=Mycolicibacterium sp. TaxID=2320850 RepID=UPI003D1334F3